VKFTKMEGAGNDYVYVDARNLDMDWNSLSRKISDRHFGVGSDGLILIKNSNVADLKMRMFNADGSEGAMCGNGIRCFAKYAIDRNIVNPKASSITIETITGIRTVMPKFDNGKITMARVAMGIPELILSKIPVNPEMGLGATVGEATIGYPITIEDVNLELSFVSMGNPHAIAFIDQPVEDFPLHSIGPKIEHHKIFPDRVNFEIVNIVGPNKLRARVWERGSGETMACGTGACAITVAATLLDICTSPVDITLPGGILTIEWDGTGEIFMEGPAREVFSGDWV
jgi:diaminopimelate epimerase